MSTDEISYRHAIADYVKRQALPMDKYGHQPRLYELTLLVGHGQAYDDDVVYAAAWLHDLGVFIGHRPESKAELIKWDHVSYTLERAPAILRDCDFPAQKVPAVLDAIQSHQPGDIPSTMEGVIVRDADILEQLGAVGILRAVAKVGRDTRYPTFTTAVEVLRRNLAELPGKLRLDAGRELAAPRVAILRAFLDATEAEAGINLY